MNRATTPTTISTLRTTHTHTRHRKRSAGARVQPRQHCNHQLKPTNQFPKQAKNNTDVRREIQQPSPSRSCRKGSPIAEAKQRSPEKEAHLLLPSTVSTTSHRRRGAIRLSPERYSVRPAAVFATFLFDDVRARGAVSSRRSREAGHFPSSPGAHFSSWSLLSRRYY